MAKLQHVFARLPRVTSGLETSLTVSGPRNKFGEVETWHWWEVAVSETCLSISSGGHFYRPSTGGDSFATMRWDITPGFAADFRDYRDRLQIVPDVKAFPAAIAAIDFAARTYGVAVNDPDNPLLEEDTDEKTEGDESVAADVVDTGKAIPWLVTPLDDAEQRLAARVNAVEVSQHEAQYAYNIETCDCCGCLLNERGLFVDGSLRSQVMWANMCAQCFEGEGVDIGWGKGQLYARQPDGSWRMVAGFCPPDKS